MRMDDAVEILNRLVGASDRLGVAVSGGADSMCLLAILLNESKIDKSNLTVINFEHGIRGESSLRDSQFVRSYAEENGLKFLGFSADIPSLKKENGRSEETEARLFRKRIFEELLSLGKVDYILTAHHEGDRTESVLMHLFRGAGVGGLVGMTEQNGKYIRPLINTPKDEILRYVKQNNIPFVTDESNFDDKYARNFLRLKVIPLIEEKYPLSSSISALSQSAKEDDEFIYSLLDEEKNIFAENGKVYLDASVLSLAPSLAKRYILVALKKVGLTADFERKHIESVLSLCDKQSGKTVELPHGFVARREFSSIVITKATDEERGEDETEFCLGLTPFGAGLVSVVSTNSKLEKGELKVDGDKIPDGAVIRYRKDGDIFTPFGGGTKKLKEYLIDKKIPLSKRDYLPLVCVENKVLCVLGVEISDEIKITENSKNCLLIRYTED